jgi:hypothetical protein
MNPFIHSLKLPLVLLTGLAISTNGLTQEAIKGNGPAKVEVRKLEGCWRLFVNHQPFFIKGGGLEFGNQELLAAAGGNSFRTWRTDNGRETGREIMDRAAKNGLYVTMGLDLARERLGFDYSNPSAVDRQLAQIKSQVLQLKNHPALLMWDIGNELNLNSHNPKVWDAVNDISKMIHQVDPNHPTTTSLAGVSKDMVAEIKRRAPNLDLLCFQSYADIVNLPREIRSSGWDGPYAVTEWGATGHWECGRTTWGAPIEDNSSVKADLYRKRYEVAIASDKKSCVGSYVFLWGQKQERTPTWYGMFLPAGQSTETVDVMQYLWTGQWPEHRSPQLQGFWLDAKSSRENIHLNADHVYPARVQVDSPSHLPVNYSWEVMEESSAQTMGGDFEKPPQAVPGLVIRDTGTEAQIKAPAKPGGYRLYVYAIDSNGKGAYANIPFYVDEKVAAVPSPLP